MAITNGYCTLPQVRAALNYNASDTTDDSTIEACVEAASRQIDGHCDRKFWQDSTVQDRQFYADSPLCVEVGDISTTTGLVVKIDDDGDGTFETTLTISTDFLVLPANAGDVYPIEPYTELRATDTYYFPRHSNGRPGVQVTAKFGWPAVPENVEQACIIQAVQLFKAPNAAFGVAGFADLGGALRIQAGLHPTAKALVARYAKAAVG